MPLRHAKKIVDNMVHFCWAQGGRVFLASNDDEGTFYVEEFTHPMALDRLIDDLIVARNMCFKDVRLKLLSEVVQDDKKSLDLLP